MVAYPAKCVEKKKSDDDDHDDDDSFGAENFWLHRVYETDIGDDAGVGGWVVLNLLGLWPSKKQLAPR